MKLTNAIILLFSIAVVLYIYVKTNEYFHLISKPSGFVSVNNTNFTHDGKPFMLNGVNDYALAYEDNQSISQTFATLHSIGITTIRFWLFGDGSQDGFNHNRTYIIKHVLIRPIMYCTRLINTI